MTSTPSVSAEVIDQILQRLADGVTLNEVCRAPGMPSAASVRRWVREDADGFADRYHAARELGWHAMADDLLAISDDASGDWVTRSRDSGGEERVVDHEHIQRSRLRVDSRKWLLARVLPHVFGDRQALQQLGADGKPIDPPTQPTILVIQK